MSLPRILLATLSLASAGMAEPLVAVTAHPASLLVLPLLGDEEETWTHVQLDAVVHPARRLAPVAHLAMSRLMVDLREPTEFEKSSIDRYTLELGARWRPWAEKGWYAEGTLGWLLESYDSRWTDNVVFDVTDKRVLAKLDGHADELLQQPYLLATLGWASDPSRRLRWDFGLGVGVAPLGGTADLEKVEWTGDLSLRKDPTPTVDLFPAAPLVFDLDFGLGVDF